MSRKRRCEKHGLLYDRYGGEHCQGCRADKLEEELKRTQAQLDNVIGRVYVALGMRYPLDRIVEPVLKTMGFKCLSSYDADMTDLKKVLVPDNRTSADWYWKVPAQVAEEIQKIQEGIIKDLEHIRQNTFQMVCRVTLDLFETKLSRFIDEKVFTKELRKAVFKDEP